MCGLIGWLSTKEGTVGDARNYAKEFVNDQYQTQIHRGTKGFGLTEINSDGSIKVRRSVEPIDMLINLKLSKAQHILLHHRQPTGTENELFLTHPMVVENKELDATWYVNHNGVIRNAKELREGHLKLGYTYTTDHKETEYRREVDKFNDSEAFAVELARFLEGKAKEISTTGPAAFMAVAERNGRIQRVVIGTNGLHPLTLSEFKEGFFFATLGDGEPIEKETAIEFKPNFTKGVLKSFSKTRTFKLPFTEVQERTTPASRVGYGAQGQQTTKPYTPTKTPTRTATTQEVIPSKFYSHSHVCTWMENSRLGSIFKNREYQNDESVILGKEALEKFKEALRKGNVEEAEGVWSELQEKLLELDIGGVMDELMADGPEWKSGDLLDALTTGEESAKHRMAVMAQNLVPIFKLASFFETALSVAWRYEFSRDTAGGGDEAPSTRAITAAQIEGHFDVHGLMHKLETCNMPQFHKNEAAEPSFERSKSEADKLIHFDIYGRDHKLISCHQEDMHPDEATVHSQIRQHFLEKGKSHTAAGCDPDYHEKRGAIWIWNSTQDDVVAIPINRPKDKPALAALPAPDPDQAEKELDKAIEESAGSVWDASDETTPGIRAEVEAGSAIAAFLASTNYMDSGTMLSEAEHVIEAVRTAASVGIEEQLHAIATSAAIDGMDITVRTRFEVAQSILTTAYERIERIAESVKKATETDEDLRGVLDV